METYIYIYHRWSSTYMVCGLLRMTWSPPWDMGLVLEVWITFDAYFNKETCHWTVDFSVFFPQFSDKLHTLADLPLIEDVSWILMIYKFDTHHMSLVDFYGYLYMMGIAIIVWHCFHSHTHHIIPLIYKFDIYIYTHQIAMIHNIIYQHI